MTDGGDGYMATSMYLMPLNWTLLKMVEVVKFMLCVFCHHKKRKKIISSVTSFNFILHSGLNPVLKKGLLWI